MVAASKHIGSWLRRTRGIVKAYRKHKSMTAAKEIGERRCSAGARVQKSLEDAPDQCSKYSGGTKKKKRKKARKAVKKSQ